MGKKGKSREGREGEATPWEMVRHGQRRRWVIRELVTVLVTVRTVKVTVGVRAMFMR